MAKVPRRFWNVFPSGEDGDHRQHGGQGDHLPVAGQPANQRQKAEPECPVEKLTSNRTHRENNGKRSAVAEWFKVRLLVREKPQPGSYSALKIVIKKVFAIKLNPPMMSGS